MSVMVVGLLLWTGTGLLLSSLGIVRRPTLATRIRPYLVLGPQDGPGAGTGRLATVGLVVGERLGRLVRSTEPLERRLRRVHHRLDPAAFRFRQLSHAVLGLGMSGVVLAALPIGLDPRVAGMLVLATPVAVFAAHEQALAMADRAQTRQVVRELPVLAEQLAMLLASGRSVSAAINRIGERGLGPGAADLRRVTRRIQQGIDERDALREWADLRPTVGVTHLVSVLTLAREATDLDRLVDQEAATIRADAHRELLAELERRSQQVWIPVTVATLLPGSLLLLVPFLDALRLFAGA
ncbi:MAG TPA: type II secretion system F family protein [Acidimicrobiales bacterium]|jgi:Flp pilus assembly protein TadB